MEEVERLFVATPNLKHRTLLMTTYAAGLRVSEVVKLQIRDIDSQRMVLRVRQGKGAKDRNTLLSPRLLAALREYYRHYQPDTWLFPGCPEDKPLAEGSARRIYMFSKEEARLKKGVVSIRCAIMPSSRLCRVNCENPAFSRFYT